MSAADKIRVKVRRQDNPGAEPYWEEFEVESRPNMNVIALLQEIRRNPVNVSGRQVAPVAWECSCLEEVCGACTMVINGRVRQACTALIDQIETPVILQPMRKFPVVRDLVVDRSRMFETLKKVHAWVEIDGTHNLGPGPKRSPEEQMEAYEYARCMTCGCCLDACPQVNDRNSFYGAAILAQVRLFNIHPTGRYEKAERLRAIMQPGGIHECGNAQNCVRVCPKKIPLTTVIARLNGDVVVQSIKDFLYGK
ncbi:MAG TPA: succinate dehydrogenase iron-sulfur subunit [bacterium]|nr:succinate dehydrogenase iron-sulfur subunit [bacterium]HQL63168.1 succinate dehydrogenase iron-sulfur subunit [bacterium]